MSQTLLVGVGVQHHKLGLWVQGYNSNNSACGFRGTILKVQVIGLNCSPSGTYSYAGEMSCLACPSGKVCSGPEAPMDCIPGELQTLLVE